jgi:hypothetical protein
VVKLEALSMGLHGGQNHMQTCSFAYIKDMHVLNVTLKEKLLLCVPLRHMGTGCSAKGNVFTVHTIKKHGDWM